MTMIAILMTLTVVLGVAFMYWVHQAMEARGRLKYLRGLGVGGLDIRCSYCLERLNDGADHYVTTDEFVHGIGYHRCDIERHYFKGK